MLLEDQIYQIWPTFDNIFQIMTRQPYPQPSEHVRHEDGVAEATRVDVKPADVAEQRENLRFYMFRRTVTSFPRR